MFGIENYYKLLPVCGLQEYINNCPKTFSNRKIGIIYLWLFYKIRDAYVFLRKVCEKL